MNFTKKINKTIYTLKTYKKNQIKYRLLQKRVLITLILEIDKLSELTNELYLGSVHRTIPMFCNDDFR